MVNGIFVLRLHACGCRGRTSGEAAVIECDGVSLTSTECAPHHISAKMVDWEISWDDVIGKAREDWDVMISAGFGIYAGG